MLFRSHIILISFYIFAKQHINSHTFSKITVSLGLLTITALVKKMEALFQPAKRSHPQDRSVTVNRYIICLPLVQEIRNNNRNPSNTAEPAQPLSLIKSLYYRVLISLFNPHNQTVINDTDQACFIAQQ